MARCDLCVKFDNCPWRSDPDAMCSAFKQRSITNADRIRSMTDEELARILSEECHGTIECPNCCGEYTGTIKSCTECWLDWLKQESEV